MAPSLLDLPRELLVNIIRRVMLEDPAVVITFKEAYQWPFPGNDSTCTMQRKRAKASNALTMVNHYLHDVFEDELPKNILYRLEISESNLEDIARWTGIVPFADIRYAQFMVELGVFHLDAADNRDQISRAIRMFTNARDIEVIFKGDRDDAANGINGHKLLFDFGRTLRSMQKLQAYRIVYLRTYSDRFSYGSTIDDVSEYSVKRLSAVSWKTVTRLTSPRLDQIRPYAREFEMEISSHVLRYGSSG